MTPGDIKGLAKALPGQQVRPVLAPPPGDVVAAPAQLKTDTYIVIAKVLRAGI